MEDKNLFTGKSIRLLKEFHAIGINPGIGEVLSGGSTLQFGEDYLLVEGEGDGQTRVYDFKGILLTEFNFEKE